VKKCQRHRLNRCYGTERQCNGHLVCLRVFVLGLALERVREQGVAALCAGS
jgi:hypothetical protein